VSRFIAIELLGTSLGTPEAEAEAERARQACAAPRFMFEGKSPDEVAAIMDAWVEYPAPAPLTARLGARIRTALRGRPAAPSPVSHVPGAALRDWLLAARWL
jgi:hypothetical protein